MAVQDNGILLGDYQVKFIMSTKENKGGLLSNEQIENDLEAKGQKGIAHNYRGSQDTGDSKLRQMGNKVQKQDGLSNNENEEQKGK